MGDFLERNYRVIATLLIVGIVFLSFSLGVEEGRRSQKGSVVLSCTDEALDSLLITKEGESLVGGGEAVEPALQSSQASIESNLSREVLGAFVGSKNGTKYYSPNCSAVKRIKPENYIWFSDEEEARLQGYAPASC